MESDQTDKTGKMLDPSDSSPERMTIPIDPADYENIGDLSTRVPDVPVPTGESNKGVEDPGTINNMALCADILKNFLSSNSIPVQRDHSEEKSKRDQSISFTLESEHENLKYDPGEGTSFPRQADALPHKPKHSQEKSKPDESKVHISNQMSVDPNNVWNLPPTNLKPSKVERTGYSIKKSIPKPIGVIVCDPICQTPYYDRVRKLDLISAHVSIESDFYRKSVVEYKWLKVVRLMNERRQKLMVDITRGQMKLEEIEHKLLKLGAPVNAGEPISLANVSEEAGETSKEIPDNIALVKPTVLEKPNMPEANPFDTKNPPIDPISALYKFCSKEEKYPDPPPLDSLDGSDGEVGDSDEVSCVSDDGDVCLSSSPPESNSEEELARPANPVPWLDDHGTGLHHQSHVEGIAVEPALPDKVSTVSHSYLVDSSDTDNDLSVDGRKHMNLMEESRKNMIDAQGESDDDSPKYILKKVPLVLDSAVSTFSSANGSPVLKKTIPTHRDGGKSGLGQESAFPGSCGSVLKILLDESEESDINIPQKVQRGGVKRHGSDANGESPKKRKLPEGAVSSYTEAGIPLPSLSPDVLSLQKKPAAESEVKVGAMEVGGVKRQGSDTVECPKKRKLPEGAVSPYTKAGIPLPSLNPDVLSLQNSGDSNEIDPKSSCLVKKLTDNSSSGKENPKRDSKSKLETKRITSPLAELNQGPNLSVKKRAPSLSPSNIDEQNTKAKVRKTIFKKSKTP